MPWAWSNAPGPMPESCRSCGEPIAPAARIDLAARRRPGRRAVRAPDLDARRAPAVARPVDDHPRDVRVGDDASGSAGAAPGRSKALVVFQRTPRRWFIWK